MNLERPKLDKNGWPKWIYPLTEDDICKGQVEGEHETLCLMGWVKFHKFKSHNLINQESAFDSFCKTLLKMSRGKKGIDLFQYNDSQHITKKHIALTWNLAAAEHGYNIPKEYLQDD